MSAIFISYERGSAQIARRVAERLRADGREVWLDADLPPHRPYSEVIRERLEAAGAVLVLWSRAAAASEWVRAEADFARQQQKLVQASLDGVLPPMPFNQIHCAELKGWRGAADNPQWRMVREALDGLLAQDQQGAPARPQSPQGSRAWIGFVAAALIAALAAGGLWLARERLPWAARPAATRVAILPLRVEARDTVSRAFADGLADQIQAVLTDNQTQMIPRADVESLAGADRERKIAQMGVRVLFDGSVHNDGETLSVALHLNDPVHHITLWSSQFSGPAARPTELQTHIATRIMAALNCASRALRPSDGLKNPQALSQYLLACDLFAQSAEDDQRIFAMMGALRQVNALEPGFAPAHAALAKYLAYHAGISPPEQAAPLRTEAKTEADRAIALDSKNADAYVALEMLEPARNWERREALLRKGLAGDPDWPHANGFLGSLLGEVGRLEEARTYYQRAAAANLLGEEWQTAAAFFDASTGRATEADAAVANLQKYWPNDPVRWLGRFGISLEERNWDRALANLDEAPAAGAFPPVYLQNAREFVKTLKSPSREGVARQRAFQRAAANFGVVPLTYSISSLAQLGLVDDAFDLSSRYEAQVAQTGATTAFLFRNSTKALRRDPRFLALAARLGLLDYWRKTGKWPDFCRDPTLPYKCQ